MIKARIPASATAAALACVSVVLVTSSAIAASQPVHTGTTSVGTVLVNAKGKTLYVFAADSPRKSTCSGACAQAWPPVPANARTLGHSADVKARLGFIRRTDGTTQLTVNGMPAYTFSGDSAAGQAKGQAVNASGGLWWVIAPSGVPITSAPAAKDTAPPAPGGASAPAPQYDSLY